MFMEVTRSGSALLNYTEYVVETESDLQKLPADEKSVAIGSKAFLADGTTYRFFGNSKKWVKTKESGQGSGSIDPDETATDDEVEEMIDDIFGSGGG